MIQPPPPPYQPFGQQPYGQQPSPYGQPPKKGNKTLWIVLGIVGGVLLLCCGSGVVVFGLFVNEVDNQIDEERENDTPSEVEVGEEFEHDDFVAQQGWRLVEDGLGDFTIEGLVLTNDDDTTRSADLDFTIYQDDLLIATVNCSSYSLGPDAQEQVDCFSTDDYVADFDTVKVADAY